MEKVNKEIMIQTLAELADMLPADGRKRDFISIRIARRGYTIYRMTPQTTAEIMTARPQFTHTIILMHGARAKINAKDYAVLNIVNISGEYSVNKDGTVIVL